MYCELYNYVLFFVTFIYQICQPRKVTNLESSEENLQKLENSVKKLKIC